MWRRNNQAVSFTLTEVFALLFFALALALAWEANQRRIAQERVEELAPVLNTVSDEVFSSIIEFAAATTFDELPEDFDELVRDLAEMQAAREALRERLSAYEDRTFDPDTMNSSELIQTMLARSREDEELANAMIQAAGIPESQRTALEQLSSRVSELEESNRDLVGQVGFLQGRGLDHPPCWADAAGAVEYAFDVVIHTDRVDVTPIWPARRDAAAQLVDGMLQLEGVGLSYTEFSRRALPILQHSRRQVPECRHFVRVIDRVDGGKDPFKSGLLTVERFFYKLLVD